MNKYKAAEELVKLYNKRYSEGGMGIQESALYVGQAANAYIRNFIWSLQKSSDFVVPFFFLKEYTETVIKDSIRDEWYVKLPIRVFDMLGENKGIYHVYPKGYEENLMIPTPTGFLGMYNGLEAKELESTLSYRPLRDRLYINGTDVGQDYEVTMNLIPDCAALAMDEELPLPPDGEYEVMEMAMNLIKIKMGMPADTSINNLDN